MAVPPPCSCNTDSNNEDNCEVGTDSTPAATAAETGESDHIDQNDLNSDRSDLNNDRSDLNSDQMDHRSDLNNDHSDHNNEHESDDGTDEAGHDPELVRKRTGS